ncbi:MAG: hypothetical protein HW416_1398 [Chloroflexi bacterium]|nr:hypothetical protein [Chloroflexota bacterium]
MAEDQRIGAVYWVDHYAVPSTDIERWKTFYRDVLGAGEVTDLGTGGDESSRTFMRVSPLGRRPYAGTFRQVEALPPSRGLGKGLPRYGYFIRHEDIDDHLRRLDTFQVPHSDPARTSEFGQDGTVIYFEDPDQNQLELWAAEHLPPGAMDGAGPLGVGDKLSTAVLESRDLDRTASFYSKFFKVEPTRSADIPNDTLAFALAGGGVLAFKKADSLAGRTGGVRKLRGGIHTAFVVREDEFLDAYHGFWAALPDSDESDRDVDPTSLPPRMYNSAGKLSRGGTMYEPPASWEGHGESWYDWDTNFMHLIGGVPEGGSMANYRSIYLEDRWVEKGPAPEGRPGGARPGGEGGGSGRPGSGRPN